MKRIKYKRKKSGCGMINKQMKGEGMRKIKKKAMRGKLKGVYTSDGEVKEVKERRGEEVYKMQIYVKKEKN